MGEGTVDWASICPTIVTSATTAGRPSGTPPSEKQQQAPGLGASLQAPCFPITWRLPHSPLPTVSAPRGSHLFSAEAWSAPPPFPGPRWCSEAASWHHRCSLQTGHRAVSAWAVEPGGLGVALRPRVDSAAPSPPTSPGPQHPRAHAANASCWFPPRPRV